MRVRRSPFLMKTVQGIEPRALFRSDYASPSRIPFALIVEGGLRKNADYGCFEKESGHNPRLFASGWLEVLLQPLFCVVDVDL